MVFRSVLSDSVDSCAVVTGSTKQTKKNMNNNSEILRAENLVKQVPMAGDELIILNGVSLSIGRGDSIAIVGESGSGKTTLLGLLAGLDVPSGGSVWLDGHEISTMGEDERARVRARVVGFVFQTFQLIDSLTALENVMLPGELRGENTARKDAVAYLERVGLGPRLRHYPKQLSGGEQQRVAIARAFASQPQVLFADEPTGNLDTGTGKLIADLLFELNTESDTTLVLVTHDTELASRCNQTTVLSAGEIVV